MSWKRKRTYSGKNDYYSISKKLRKELKSTEEFEVMLSSLSLEEIVALKLEISTKTVNKRLYGIPIWNSLTDIVRDAAFKYAYSATRTKTDAMRMLGLKENEFFRLRSIYDPSSYFTENDKKEI
tara:strand:+ start:614 stop:985 length:372 start_codon:yes stop_codon:yes gene_type:complete